MPQRTKKFTCEGRKLHVEASLGSEGWKVRVVENGRPVTGLVYGVSYETSIDARMRTVPIDLVDELMALTQEDVERHRIKLV